MLCAIIVHVCAAAIPEHSRVRILRRCATSASSPRRRVRRSRRSGCRARRADPISESAAASHRFGRGDLRSQLVRDDPVVRSANASNSASARDEQNARGDRHPFALTRSPRELRRRRRRRSGDRENERRRRCASAPARRRARERAAVPSTFAAAARGHSGPAGAAKARSDAVSRSAVELGAACRARRDVRHHRVALHGVEDVERDRVELGEGLVVAQLRLHRASSRSRDNRSRNFNIASRIRVLIVPSG